MRSRLAMLTAAVVGVWAIQGRPGWAVPTTNGFNTNWILVLRGGTWESEICILNESAADPLRADLGPFGWPAYGTWPKAVTTPQNDGDPQDAGIVKSICFSNSPVAGINSPAGVRLFGVYDVRAFDEPGTPGALEVSYFSVGFQIVEFAIVPDSNYRSGVKARRVRVMQVGLAANLNPGNVSKDSLVDTCWPDCSDPVWYRNNTNGCRVGTIRYNRAKDTLCVAANIGEHDNGDVCLPPVGRVYEFKLPDWPEVYYTTGPYAGQPIPQSDPALVNLVQVYEMPHRCETSAGPRYDVDRCECLLDLQGEWYTHNVAGDNGRTGRNEGQRPAIAFDDAGNMYFTSRFFSADPGPTWDAGNGRWSGTGLWWGDVLRVSTLDHWAGKDKYVVPITGAEACNIAVSAEIEDALKGGYPQLPYPSVYDGGPGLAVRGDQLIQLGEIECNDPDNVSFPWFVYVNLFDLAGTLGGAYPCERVRTNSLSNHRCDIPRKPNYAQLDEESRKTFLSNLMGACDCAQNFMYILPNNTVVHDVGYFLSVANPDGSSPGVLTHTWDAASPPGAPINQVGACCRPDRTCAELTQTACVAADGFWQGNQTTCDRLPCPQGACYKPCGMCEQVLDESACTAEGGAWDGLRTVCGQGPRPKVCPMPMVDSDCDGDVDMVDFAEFQRCLTIGSTTSVSDACACFDTNDDDEVNALDLGVFGRCGSGPQVLADPGCG